MRRRLNEGTPIPLYALTIGMLVHLKGTDFGCVWRIIGIERDDRGEIWLRVQTPVTGKVSRARASRARYIRAQQPNRNPYY